MATRVHATAAIRWARGARNDPEVLALVSLAPGDSISDITGQVNPAGIATNVYLVDADLAQATATAINTLISGSSSANVFVLASETYDDTDPNQVRTGNYDATPTAGQLTTFGTELLNRFPGLNASQLQQAGQNILRAGLTRRMIIALLAQRFAQL